MHRAQRGYLGAGAAQLAGRRDELSVLGGLVDAVREGESRVLVVRGEPGVGKTTLLEHVAGQEHGCQVARVAGVQSETELAFAGLHQLCAPMLGRAERLPLPQQDALRTAFGLVAGPPPDRFIVGLAALNLLSEVAAERPLICLIDDGQWLDRASAQALGFTARRLAADPVGLVFAARDPGAELAGLPELGVGGLPDNDARALLDSALAGPLDDQVRDLIVAETRGNPLALLELPDGLSPAELAGGFGLPRAAPLTGRAGHAFDRQLAALPAQTRRLVLLAAADPSGDRSLVWRAAGRLGIEVQAAEPAAEAGLVEFGGRVRFRHPLARSAAYQSASLRERREAHAALAEATDQVADPDRRAWHRAQAVSAPDEEVAVELECSAGRARSRGGLAAAAAFLERSVALTPDPVLQSARALAAAQVSLQAGGFGSALDLLAAAEAGPLDEFAGARVDLLRGEVVFASGHTGDAATALLKAARRLEPFDLDLARETYLAAWGASILTVGGHADGHGEVLQEICRSVLALPPPPDGPRPLDLTLEGLALLITDGHAAAAPTLQRAAKVLTSIPVEEVLRWGWVATRTSSAVWDYEGFHAISARQVQLVREVGALAHLPLFLSQVGVARAWMGDFAGAEAVAAESASVAARTGNRFPPHVVLLLRAMQGREAEAAAAIAAAIEGAAANGQGAAATFAHWAEAVLHNGLAHYKEAAAAARQAAANPFDPWSALWALPELVEAAARLGDDELARDALERLAVMTQPSGNDPALGIEARCRALLSDGADADDLYREAIDRLGLTRLRPELARAHLLYGEWLRREGRRVEAREQLRAGHDLLAALGLGAFAERARRELIATGEKVRKRGVETRDQLTPQEEQIARLARDGRTNPEIAAQLFLSARTVEWHLGKVFGKLGVSSRRELTAALGQRGPDGQPA
jgi:DNA-binding CsgD family transcriptional regulator/predicted negative regulator of RcsB-dependent stress response